MNVKVRKIEVDAETAELLEARAAALGISVSALLAELAGNEPVLPPPFRRTCAPTVKDVVTRNISADDAHRLAEFERTRIGVPWDEARAWLESWGTPNALPPPAPRKL